KRRIQVAFNVPLGNQLAECDANAIHQAALSRTFSTSRRFTRCFACQRSRLYCMASQLSAERPRALESRRAISGLTLLFPIRTRCSVAAATPSLAARSGPLRLLGLR